LARRLGREPFGFEPIGLVTTNGRSRSGPLPIAGTTRDLAQAIRVTRAECLFVASTAVPEADMPRILSTARRAGTVVWVSANLPEVLSGRLSARSFGEVMALSLRPVRLSGWQLAAKRLFDLGLGGLALLLSLVPWAIIAVVIKASSPGPILFRQERVTKGGRVFTMYKFRTMVTDCDALLTGRRVDTTSLFFKLRDDPRLTRAGRWLRRTSLDELPQLWNVLRGDMSLVGPRPLPAEQVRAHASLLEPRHEVRAGITGWWQISGRSDLHPGAAARLDLFYIENWSLARDLFILAKTLPAVLTRRGAV
jgi:exopolysaccharide biosynthesis polyprenyl glycosylphosphotransferase